MVVNVLLGLAISSGCSLQHMGDALYGVFHMARTFTMFIQSHIQYRKWACALHNAWFNYAACI